MDSIIDSFKAEKYIFVKALTNYDDFVYKFTKVIEPMDLGIIRKIADILSKHPKLRNWENYTEIDSNEHHPEILYSEFLSAGEISLFENNYIPETEKGIHSIEKIVIFNVSSTEKLF